MPKELIPGLSKKYKICVALFIVLSLGLGDAYRLCSGRAAIPHIATFGRSQFGFSIADCRLKERLVFREFLKMSEGTHERDQHYGSFYSKDAGVGAWALHGTQSIRLIPAILLGPAKAL